MCVQKLNFHIYHIGNRHEIKKVTRYNIYYLNNVFNENTKSNTLETQQQKDIITQQTIDRW
jgi:hypothetical protein